MARALRVDKITLAALGATLRLLRDPAGAAAQIPLLQLLSTSEENLKNRAERIAVQLEASELVATAQAVEDETYLGGGSVPTQQIKTWCIAVEPSCISIDKLCERLRKGSPAIICRVQKARLLVDLRSVLPRQDRAIVGAFHQLAEELNGDPPA